MAMCSACRLASDPSGRAETMPRVLIQCAPSVPPVAASRYPACCCSAPYGNTARMDCAGRPPARK